MRTALDTNIISAIWTREQNLPEIIEQLKVTRSLGSIVICPVVYIELCAHPRATLNDVLSFLADTDIAVNWEISRKVWDHAANAFSQYAIRHRKSRNGSPRRIPADFIIGAHAVWMADRLLTLDQSRYRTDFPGLRIKEC